MNFSKLFSLIVFSLLLFPSCEDVIELDLATTDAKLVIEANLDAGKQKATVIITKSNDFYDNSQAEGISGANVVLQKQNGAEYILQENEVGIYSLENVDALPDDIFTLAITLEGEVYEATSKVPHPVSLDQVDILENGGRPFTNEEGSISLSATWKDPLGIENFYRIRTYVDSVLQTDIYTVFNDSFIGDGNEESLPLRDQFKENTSVTVELLSTDEHYYDYFFQLSSIVGDGFNSTTPFNPEGNLGENVLGYFGIYFSSSLSIEL